MNIMGGPSILERRFDLSLINKDKFTVFLEAKSLTPKFLEYGLQPDYFLMFFPEKCQSNTIQHVMYQSFLMDIDLSKLLRDEYLEEYNHYKTNFEEYLETWNPAKGPYKKYRWKFHVKLKNSPFDLLPKLPNTAIITRKNALEKFCEPQELKKDVYEYANGPAKADFSLEEYYNPVEENGMLFLNSYNHLNSAAIALFPLQAYMGFKKIYFIGMDMSMLGSMEYNSLYTFKSIGYYKKFFKKARPVFNPCFKENRKRFMRPPYEFDDLKNVLSYNNIEFANIYEPFEFALPLEGVRNIAFKDFLDE